ncbi:hypothetical protein QUB68_29710 [Microcoleus sp. A006_D1]|uniref:hypothetical protein n=1 Tax=Microcoleus sp. A006_D1 TaxID=3055267 RepID=UPI002FD19A83
MTRATATLNTFVMVAVASSLVTWLATLHPTALHFIRALYALTLCLWALGWILDDALIARFKIDVLQYRGILVGSGVAITFGLGVILCRS